VLEDLQRLFDPRLAAAAEEHVGVEVQHVVVRGGQEGEEVGVEGRSPVVLRRHRRAREEVPLDGGLCDRGVVDVDAPGVRVPAAAVLDQVTQARQALLPAFCEFAPASVQVHDEQHLVDLVSPLAELVRHGMDGRRQIGRRQVDLQRDGWPAHG
jgi:hypothetical protein